MRVLLVHPEDSVPPAESGLRFDLIVDLARAPNSAYDRWGRERGCRVMSIYDLADSVGDLLRARQIIGRDRRELLDGCGIDWWELASYLVVDGLLAGMLLHRLAREIGAGAEVFCTRADARAEILQSVLGSTLVCLTAGHDSLGQRIRRYGRAMAKLNSDQITQVVADKWDPQHNIRRRFEPRTQPQREPIVLLPSAYVNISRTAIAYAKLLPDQKFLLVYARSSGKLADLPANVQCVALHPYYESQDARDLPELLDRWKTLRQQLISSSEEMRMADRLGAMSGVPSFMERGVAARDAWNRVFELHPVVGCLSADDTNAYTRIPLVLAERRGLASVACHHGALDFRMAVKEQYGDTFLAKSEMERDYLENVCQIAAEKITLGGPASPRMERFMERGVEGNWLMFFTEPYATDAWRMEEVYRELLPKLLDLARECGLRLVLKLHPFESAKEHRNLHARLLPPERRRELDIMEGPLPGDDWRKVRFSMTVQSSVALECTQRGIPVFLCAWLQSRYGGYLQQFAKFGAGMVLENAAEIATIPQQLAKYTRPPNVQALGTEIDPAVLRGLLAGKHPTANFQKSRAH